MGLLATKTYIPPIRDTLVPRQHLIERLNAGLSRKLTLVSAPAGFGKTTLISEWGCQINRPMAWLSLAAGDNEPIRFWRYVVAALQTVDERLGCSLQAGLVGAHLSSIEAIVDMLIGDLVACGSAPVLVLDDYHLITSLTIHDSLNYFLDHISQELHLVISTRADPPLALHLRRARAQMNEIRAADLGFTHEETAEFLNARLGLALSPEDIARLESRTEGWVAGLQMAALSLQTLQSSDRHDFVTTFAGDDRYIADYLLEEVFRRQSERVQSFLLQTSILDQLCGSLCDAVTGYQDGQSILAYLEQTNLFVIPLDNRRYWYRYHHLFADLLRQRLEQQVDKQHVQHMKIKASEWCEREGQLVCSVGYAFASKSSLYTANLIERHVLDMFYRSEIMLVRNWLFSLPEEVVRARPLLSAVYASLIALTEPYPESPERAEEWVQHAEKLLDRPSASDDPAHNIARGFIAKFRVYLAGFRGADPHTIIELYHKAQDILPDKEMRFQSALLYRLARAHWDLGDDGTALPIAREAERVGSAHNDLFNATAAICLQADIICSQGRLHEAFRAAEDGLRKLNEIPGSPVVPEASNLYFVMATILYEWNDLEEASHYVAKGLEMARLADLGSQISGTITLAKIRYAQGQREEAYKLLEHLQCLCPGLDDALIRPTQVHFWLRHAETEPALVGKIREWAGAGQLAETSGQIGYEQLVRAQALIALHRWLPAGQRPDLVPVLAFLDRWVRLARERGHTRWLIGWLTLQALALVETGCKPEAMNALREALELAEPQGYIRLFLDKGPVVVDLLRLAAGQGKGSANATRLLKIIRGSNATAQKVKPGLDALDDPLSPREVEVLRLVLAGTSNQEIADTLFVSVSTVKTHISHIFDKLQVANRAQAIVRTQQLGLFN